eukprot:m.63186 g.63186  ORF g.63186 m.63186 type:complete len:97 (+) comp35153_c0_seq14:985-1275(+)
MSQCKENPHGSTTTKWIAAFVERRYNNYLYARIQIMKESSSECARLLSRLVCTFPTCTENGRLQDWLTVETCSKVFSKWYTAKCPQSYTTKIPLFC